MQHRIQVGLRFYSVTAIQEGARKWLAIAETAGGWLVESGGTLEGALNRWQAAAADVLRHSSEYPVQKKEAPQRDASS